MTMKQLLAISMAMAMVFGSISPVLAFAEPAVPFEMLECQNDSNILVERPNGKLACVKETTAQKLGWEKISITTINDTITQTDSKNIQNTLRELTQDNIVEISDRQLSKTNIGKESNLVSELGDVYFWPQFTLSYPEQGKVGEPVNFVKHYQFANPRIDDDDNGVDFENWNELEGQCPVEVCGDYKIWIGRHSNVDLINRPDYVFDNKITDTEFTPHRSGETGYVKPAYNNTAPQQETFTFVINRPNIDYNFGEISIEYQPTDDGLIYYYIAPNDVIHFSDEPISVAGESGSTLTKDYSYIIESMAVETVQDPPLSEIPYIAEFFAEHHPNSDVETELRNANYTQGFIDKFFEANPNLKAQSFIPSAYWLLPQAFGASNPFTFVYSTLKYADKSGNTVTLSNTKVCAFDKEGNTLTPLMNGRTHICTTSDSNGNYRFGVPRTDPNGIGNTDYVPIAYADNNKVVVYKNNNQDVHNIASSNSVTLPNSRIYQYGDFTLSQTNISLKAFHNLKEQESISNWYIPNVGHTPPKLHVVWSPDSCQPTNLIMICA